MKIRYFISTLIIGLIPLILAGQSSAPGYHPLKVGDTLPDYRVRNLINYPKDEVNLKEFQGKLLILDFWTSRCYGCVASWPKLLELNDKYGDDVQLLLVNAVESEEKVRSVIAKRKEIAGVDLTLPTVFHDSTFLKLFPHSGDPYIVWINKDGIVKSISHGRSLNKRSISNFIRNGDPNVLQRIEEYEKIDYRQPFYINGNGSLPRDIFHYSIFSRSERESGFSLTMSGDYDIKKGNYFVSCINAPIIALYRLAYADNYIGAEYGLPIYRIILDVEEKYKYTGQDSFRERLFDYLYTYQLILKTKHTKESIKSIMQSDLDRYIGLNVKIEKRSMPSYVLTATDTSKIFYNGGEYKFSRSDSLIIMNKFSVRSMLKTLLSKYYFDWKYPLIDDTGLKGRLGKIELQISKMNLENLDRELAKYGMRLKVEEREIEVLVLSEPEGYVFPYETKKEENEEKAIKNTN